MDTLDISIKGILFNRENQKPLAGITIEAWDKDQFFKDSLGNCITDNEGRFQISFKEKILWKRIIVRKPTIYFKIYYRRKLIHSTENEVNWSFKSPNEVLVININCSPERLPVTEGITKDTYNISGKILSSNGLALSRMSVEAILKSITDEVVVGKTESDKDGKYSISFIHASIKDAPDIQVKTCQASDEKSCTLSPVKYNASFNEEIDLIVKADKASGTSEFETILKDVRPFMGKLSWNDLKETKDIRQITYLSNKTGWDSRITAMMAASHQIGGQLKTDPAHIYALLRAGVTGTADAIKALSVSEAKIAIEKAIGNHIIQGSGNLQETLNTLNAHSIDFLLSNTSAGSVSSMNDMLGLRLNADQKGIFAGCCKESGRDSGKLWSGLQQKGFSPDVIPKLKLDGKLGYLTGNNAGLIKKIYRKFNISNESELAGKGLYKPSEWKQLIGTDVPASLTADEYAVLMANQVKMSFPNIVAGEMVRRDEINLGENVPKEELLSFFTLNQSINALGSNPVKTWEGFEKLSIPAKASARTVERLYQISPSNEAMTVLAENGITSAHQIARYTKSEFLSAYGAGFPNMQQAVQTYTKANEVYSASLSLATQCITNQMMPNIYAITGLQEKTQEATIAFPTLEELFGNMDYCSCESCKSVLSPAAYLVELLQFIDLTGIPHNKSNPVDVLLGKRRPDIQHIQLSCENTNIALPYIDLVNEILEYYIIHGDLEKLMGHDVTDPAQQNELLAEPQFVDKTVYDMLKTKVYPYNLPFHQPLETLRRLFQVWGLSLDAALNIFSTPFSARKEALGFSENEYAILTNSAYKNLPEYFGEPAGNTIAQLNAAIANGKTFSRIAGISYEALVELLKTNFINPGYVLVPLFLKLQIGLDDLQKFYTGSLSDSQLDAMIPSGVPASDYGGDFTQWLRDNQQLIMGLITLTDVGTEPSDCNFAQYELRYALPDNTANTLNAIAYHKFHRFLRILMKTGWSIPTLDNILKVILPIPSAQITEGNIDAGFVTVFSRLANFKRTADTLSYSEKKFPALLLILDPSLDLSLRQEQCAKLLKLSIPELIELSAISGIDPFADDLESDEPSLLKMILLVRKLRGQSLKVADLAYMLHNNDMSGKLALTEESLLKNIKLLRDTLNTIERETSLAPDNADFAFAKNKMLMVYDAGTTDEFFGLLLGTKTYASALISAEESLPVSLLVADPGLGYNPFSKELIYMGILTAAARTVLAAAADSLVLANMGIITVQADLDTFKADFKNALTLISNQGNNDLLSFGLIFPELKTIYDAIKLEPSPSAQAQKLVNSILPELKSKLKETALKVSLTGILKADPDIVSVFTSKKETIRSAADASKSVLFDFTGLEQKLVFNKNQTYDFYIDFPVTDDYLLYVSAPENTVVHLKVDGQVVINNVTIGPGKEVKNLSPLSLKTGVIKSAELTLSSLPSGTEATIWWRTKGIAKSIIPDNSIFLSDNVNFARTSLIRLSKASQLQNLFRFTPVELDYFASANAETKDFLNALDTDGSISTSALLILWGKIELLVYFNALKKQNEPEDNTWVQILKDTFIKNAQSQLLLESINLWQEADLTEILAYFSINRAELSKLSVLKKAMEAMEVVSTIGFPAISVKNWITNDPAFDLVAGIKDTVKQKITEASWLETMQSVSDPVRNLMRDALVSYILQYKKPSPEIINPDKLYEYFLIDVEMDACMKTSRIRQALSTVQLFIQRCLINLEPDVDPASIRAEQWTWMKRYRVWEANRKVFLYPENWLEPELRDNKSSLFKELEGELLQAEVTDESAELAFLNYLKKLDDIAKLEMVGMYLEEHSNQDDDILHVFGRTNGNTRQYYYRRYEYGYWTPWEKVNLNIEGEQLIPIIWRKRLFVFWLSIFEKPADVNGTKSPQTLGAEAWSSNSNKNVEINICWGEYFKGKWTSPKSNDLKRPMIMEGLSQFDRNAVLIYGRTEAIQNPPGKFRERVVLYIRYRGPGAAAGTKTNGVFTFTSKNARPYLEYKDDTILYTKVRDNLYLSFFKPYEGTGLGVGFDNTNFLMPDKDFKVNVKQPGGAGDSEITETVLSKKNLLTDGFSILPTWHPVKNQLEAPMAYADEHSTFFVQPDEEVYIPIWRYDDYYPVFEEPIHYEIPPLVEKPIKGWPPEEIINYGDTVIDNPWEINKEMAGVNTNITKVIATSKTFTFGATEFGGGGKAISGTENIF